MNDENMLSIAEETPDIFEPDAEILAHASDFDTYEARLAEAERDYREACEDYEASDPSQESIMDAAETVELAAKELIARALVMFHMFPTTEENKQRARMILDKITKDANKREQTCCNLYRHIRKTQPEKKEKINSLLRKKFKRMKFLDRCMRTQSYYDKKSMEGSDHADPIHKIEAEQSAKAERTRRCIPEGHRWLPPRIFPHDPIPEGLPVPTPPQPYMRVEAMEAAEKVFDTEHDNFVLAPDYISEDGLIDGESVVWDYVNNKVTMKYRGGVPVTWDFWQPKDTFDVLGPNDWCVQYMQRAWAQEYEALLPGLFKRRAWEREIPEYDRIPVKSG